MKHLLSDCSKEKLALLKSFSLQCGNEYSRSKSRTDSTGRRRDGNSAAISGNAAGGRPLGGNGRASGAGASDMYKLLI